MGWRLSWGLICLIIFVQGNAYALSNSAATYRQQGLDYRSQGDFDQAITALEQAVQLEPQHLSGLVLLGWTQHLAGKGTQAAQTLWQALFQQPAFPETANALGIVYLVRGELNAAILVHEWAKLLKPNNEIAHYNLSLSYQLIGQIPLAIAHGKIAAQLEPQNPHPLISLAVSHWQDQNRVAAIAAYQTAINLDSRYGQREFLNQLTQAGFNSSQIAIAQMISDLKP
ncbi:MAG: tetratricopeptide repeat protein [Pseudanabaenaceae cyanobacterium bins.68]|nr:tetratricopeptide repeat protein [Pseudanabaenaceae cyanobacterium bins.68]